jgi:hypothetical protein
VDILGKYREWRGERLKFRAEIVWLLDEALDQLPAYQDGKWYRYGQWGCRLQLARYWGREEFSKDRGPDALADQEDEMPQVQGEQGGAGRERR